MKPKAKTNLQKMGFMDNDRNHTIHDEIQIWILENPIDFLKSLSPQSDVKEISKIKVKLEDPVHSNYSNTFIVGFIDVIISFQYKNQFFEFNVEIKSKIESFGEVLRQVNTYKNYKRGEYVIICEDDRYKESFKKQDIRFIKYKRK